MNGVINKDSLNFRNDSLRLSAMEKSHKNSLSPIRKSRKMTLLEIKSKKISSVSINDNQGLSNNNIEPSFQRKKYEYIKLKDVINEISIVRKRINNNNSSSFISNLNNTGNYFSKKIMNIKQENMLENYKKFTEKWKKQKNIIAEKIQRNEDKLLINQVNDFRKKIEVSQAFELIKGQQEKFGSDLWIQSLRNYHKNNLNNEEEYILSNSLVSKTIKDDFLLEKFIKNPVEIIRKPGRESVSQSNFTTKIDKSYFEEKVEDNKKTLSLIFPTKEKNFKELQVIE